MPIRHALAWGLVLTGPLLAGCGTTTPGAAPVPASARPAHVAGTVLAAPTCPVERADSPCPPAHAAGVAVRLLRGNRVVTRDHTDRAGRFRFTSAPGRYVVRVSTKRWPHATASRRVRLVAGQTVTTTLTVDTGIR